MTADVSTSERFSPVPAAESARRLSIGFINWAHAIDHYVMLIFPTVVIELAVAYDRSYADLLVLSTASFIAFGLFSLPAGWLADRWSRRDMMIVYYVGCGLSLIGAAFAPSMWGLGFALLMLGVFAAIYHPVGTAMLIEAATQRGRSLAFDGVCGNFGTALAAGITAILTAALSWRAAFLVPGLICVATGAVYYRLVPADVGHKTGRNSSPEVGMPAVTGAIMFGLFVVVALTAGLVFNTLSVALPKIVDERIGGDNISLVAVGGLTTGVFLCGAIAQIVVGRLAERFKPHILFAVTGSMQFVGVAWSIYATGPMLFAALAFTMAAIYAQVTVNDLVIARYTADAWRGRVYAVRYFLTFMISGAAVSMIAVLYGRGGFSLVLGATAAVGFGLLVAAIFIAFIASGVERGRVLHPAPAE